MMSETNFSYDPFDRQTQNLLRMAMTVMDGWEDYASTEMNMDLKSLTIKASKVCFLADQDRALQSENLIQERKEANHALHLAFSDFVSNRLNPFVCLIIQNLRDGQGMKGGQVTQFAHNSIHEVLPMIASLIEAGGTGTTDCCPGEGDEEGETGHLPRYDGCGAVLAAL